MLHDLLREFVCRLSFISLVLSNFIIYLFSLLINLKRFQKMRYGFLIAISTL